MATATAAAAFSLKLFIDTKAPRVLFAEASRDAVSFLHSLLVSHLDSLPLDSRTRPPAAAAAARLRRRPRLGSKRKKRFFVCGDKRGAGCGKYVADRSGATCPSCGGTMAAEVPPGAPGAGGSEQQEAAAAAPALVCMLKDNLTVVPATGTFLALAGNIMRGVVTGFQEAAAFQVATVRLGHNEGLKILEASLRSSTVLTDVFLRDKAVALEFDPSPPSPDLGWM
ncbi:uncharacterized protein [Setaria viridis]|uniref:Uncharacterized protein n=1 Tax=Setaria viridis TaxID=4556 RepID=A0A4U6UC20_SETVI|nr:uncharacterized protein LOC117858643 [Setaria viridis]TKW13511.1 hypothetical protein SEVIR_5G106000v2 [Setaria viridis]